MGEKKSRRMLNLENFFNLNWKWFRESGKKRTLNFVHLKKFLIFVKWLDLASIKVISSHILHYVCVEILFIQSWLLTYYHTIATHIHNFSPSLYQITESGEREKLNNSWLLQIFQKKSKKKVFLHRMELIKYLSIFSLNNLLNAAQERCAGLLFFSSAVDRTENFIKFIIHCGIHFNGVTMSHYEYPACTTDCI